KHGENSVIPREPPSARGDRVSLPANVKNKRIELAPALDARPNAARVAGPIDPVLAAVVVALIGFGIVMVYSASAVQATVQYHDPQFFLKRQVGYALASLVVFFGLSRIDYHRL